MVDEVPVAGLPPLPPDAWRGRRLHPLLRLAVIGLALAMSSCVGCFVIGSRAVKDGAAYADASVRAITASWDPAAFPSNSYGREANGRCRASS
jgi:hypothetical protein